MAFFKVMHLLKAKATLNDYLDLNRRYFKTTGVVIFEDDTVRFDIVPKHFFKPIADTLFEEAFSASARLRDNCAMEEISTALTVNESHIIDGIKNELGVELGDMEQARQAVLDEKLRRFNSLVDRRFSDKNLIALLDMFATRKDEEIRSSVSDNADIPTIFEYILGVIWYKLSDKTGNILQFMNLSLEADLLPKTHAGGGEADIVYCYSACEDYPDHCLLIEATLADGTNQRRMEMEPVSRHLGEHILQTGNSSSYCVFSSTHLDRNVVSDFRNRKTFTYYNQNFTKGVNGLKIIPLKTTTLKEIIKRKLNYGQLYKIFEAAYRSDEPIPSWYSKCIDDKVAQVD